MSIFVAALPNRFYNLRACRHSAFNTVTTLPQINLVGGQKVDTTILSTLRLSRNDISSLAHIFDVNFRRFCANNSPFATDYLSEIKTIVGLGFTAVLLDGSFIAIYHDKFNNFLRHLDFKKHENSLQFLSSNIAEMIDLATFAFRLIKYPSYYENFANALRKALGRVGTILSGENTEVERLLQLILWR